MNTKTTLDLFLIALVLAASVHDLVERKIPNRLIGCGLLSAGVLHLASGVPFSMLSTGLAGLAVGFAIFFPLYCVRGMAAGDVKLMAMAGAFTGPVLALEIALAAFCVGGVMALAIVIAQGFFAAQRTDDAMAGRRRSGRRPQRGRHALWRRDRRRHLPDAAATSRLSLPDCIACSLSKDRRARLVESNRNFLKSDGAKKGWT